MANSSSIAGVNRTIPGIAASARDAAFD